MTTESSLSQRFIEFSAEVTAFSAFDLHGTGHAQTYLSTVVRVVGEEVLADLLEAHGRAAAAGDARALAREVFSDEKFGPIARNIIKLWYAGIWYELPPEWTETFGALANDGTFTASPQAYPEALLWRAVGANPPGARAPGYGSWAFPPVFPPIPGEEPVSGAGHVPTATRAAPAGVTLAEVPAQRGPAAQPLVTDQVKETAR